MALTRSELGFAVRQLMRASRSATLSTALSHGDGWPYGSLVTVAIDADASPLMLFSTLSDHTRNLEADDRASLLFEQASRLANPQRGPRVTVLGQIRRTNKKPQAARFLAIHPEASLYAGFGDFAFYRMTIERVHWVGGFAKAQWLVGRFVSGDAKAAKAVAAASAGIIEHMNEDHGAALDLYAQRLLGRRGKGWRMIGVDPDGADLALGRRHARLAFPEPVRDAAGVRDVLVAFASHAKG